VTPESRREQEQEHDEPVAPRSVHVEDVDDVIGLAAQMKNAAADRLTVDDLKEVGRELEIEERFVERAVQALEERRRQAELEARRRAERRRKQALVGVAVLGVLVAIVAGGTLSARASLREALSDVERRRAQVVNVIERQARVESRYRDAPPSPERDAELAGAENRVRIERARYDEAAARYNAAAGGPFARLAGAVSRVPARVPLSNEVKEW
jgi:hypothetical protein